MHLSVAILSMPHRSKETQRGAALMLMLIIVVLGIVTTLVSSLSTSALKSARQATTATALAQAKDALIGYAASDSNRPGELPCPDVDGDGMLKMGVDYNYGTPSCIAYVGYLPWKTLDLPELRGGDNEKLWYALSQNFYAGNNVPLNSDTPGQLSISGNQSGSNIAAIIFAPGAPLCGKSHSTNNVDQYLEAMSSVTATSAVVRTYSNECSSYPYNDTLLALTTNQLFQVVEKRVGSEIKQALNTYYTAWGAFPFAVPFTDPSIANYAGQLATYNGLLPFGNGITPVWNAPPVVTLNSTICNNGTSPSCTCSLRPLSCTTGCTYWRCDFSGITGTPTIRIDGVLNGVGFGMWRPYDPSAGSSTSREVGVIISGNTYYDAATTVLNNATVSGNLNNTNGSATVTFSGTVKSGSIPTRIQLLTTNIPPYTTPTSSPVIPAWLWSNNWQQVAYYAVSLGYAPGGGNFCNPLPSTPPCLTVSGNVGDNNKQAVIIMTGSALASAHPSGNLSNYLEGENASPADFIYEIRSRSNTSNDNGVIVAP